MRINLMMIARHCVLSVRACMHAGVCACRRVWILYYRIPILSIHNYNDSDFFKPVYKFFICVIIFWG